MNKVIIWVRSSTDRQTIDDQLKETKEFARSLGYTDEQFIVIGRRGASAYKVSKIYKEELQKMYSTIEKGGVEAVFCWHLNRLARNEVAAMEIKEFLVRTKTQLYIKEPTIKLLKDDGSVDDGAELVFSLFSTLNKQQIREFKAKTARARRSNKENKVFNGGKVRLGYTLDEDKHYIIDEKDASIIREVFHKYIYDGYTIGRLSEELNSRGYDIKPHQVFDILKTTLYWDGEKYPPIITKEEWDMAKEKRRDNASSATKQSGYHYFLNRLIKCKCGAGYTVTKGGYKCGLRDINRGEHSRELSTKWTDGLLWMITSSLEVKRLMGDAEGERTRIQGLIKEVEEKIVQLKKSLEKVDSKMKRIKELYVEGEMSKDEYKEGVERIKSASMDDSDRLEQLQAEREKLNSMLVNEKDNRQFIKEINISKEIQLSDEESMQKIVRRWVKNIIVDDDYIIYIYLINGMEYKCRYMPKKAVKGTKFYTIGGKPIMVTQLDRVDKKVIPIYPKKVTPENISVIASFISGSKIV